MFTGVRRAAGIALLAASRAALAGGSSVLSQRAESGEVDWGKAAVDTVVEVVIGALGGAGVVAAGTRAAHAAASASRLGRAALVIGGVNSAAGGIGGASSHVVNRDTQQPWSWRDFAGKTAGGAVSSGLGETGGARGRDPGAGERLCRALDRRPGLEPRPTTACT